MKWFVVALAAHMIDRWASDGITLTTGSTTGLTPADLMNLTEKDTLNEAENVLEEALKKMSLKCHRSGKRYIIHWPKWAEIQGSGRPARGGRSGRDRASKGPNKRPSDARTSTPPHPNSYNKRREAPEHLESDARERVLQWVATVIPPDAERVDALIERSLGYYRAQGKKFSDWGQAVINAIRNYENATREHRGEPPLPTLEQARIIKRRADEIRASNAQTRLS